ncbi:bcl-2/adenovirus E1B 19 kDa-interacting protein 2-like protein [Pholidichthys leucotaenia]
MESRMEEQEEEILRSDEQSEIFKTTNSVTADPTSANSTNATTATAADSTSTSTLAHISHSTSVSTAAACDDQIEDEETGGGDDVAMVTTTTTTTANAQSADEEEEEEEDEDNSAVEEEEIMESEQKSNTLTTIRPEDEETDGKDDVTMVTTANAQLAGEEKEKEEEKDKEEENSVGEEEIVESEQKADTPTTNRPAPPTSLALSEPQPMKKKVLAAPALSLSLDRSESAVSDDFPSAFLSPSPEDEEDPTLDFDLDAMETPSDSESLHFPIYDLHLEDDLRRLGVASYRRGPHSSRPRADSRTGSDHTGLGALDREDVVDPQGVRWRCFSTGDPPQESQVNMTVLEPFLRVLSHGGYYGDGMNDIIVFSSCYLPENSLENYQYVMDNLFRFVVGTLDLMVAENYVIVYFCAGGQKDKLPGISWLRECYTTIDRKLRKNLKGFFVVHPTWAIKALITIIKPFISSKFSRKLKFVDSLKSLSQHIPTEHVQIPDCVAQYDQSLSR